MWFVRENDKFVSNVEIHNNLPVRFIIKRYFGDNIAIGLVKGTKEVHQIPCSPRMKIIDRVLHKIDRNQFKFLQES